MGMTQEIRVESGALHVHASGEFSLGEAHRAFQEVLEAVAQHKLAKVLYDGRELTGKLDTWERFQYGESVATAVAEFARRDLSLALQFAYVLKEPVLDPSRFGETVAVNRGVRGKVFDNMEDALEWLGIPSANDAM